MNKQPNILDDLLTLGSSVLGNLTNARHEIKAQARQQVELVAQKLDLVGREEFDAAFAMLAKARATQEKILERLDTLESKTKSAATKTTKKSAKTSLLLVKKSRPKSRRR